MDVDVDCTCNREEPMCPHCYDVVEDIDVRTTFDDAGMTSIRCPTCDSLMTVFRETTTRYTTVRS